MADAHALAGNWSVALISRLYLTIWAALAVFFPVWLVLIDRDTARVSRFLFLYVLLWVGFGNILALVFMSTGPVYYDLLIGGDRFLGLNEALQESGISQSVIGHLQSGLWKLHTGETVGIGSGISAFPNMHVRVATLLMLYLFERSRVLALLGIGYLCIILFLSVYVGFHYAIDGYVAILLVCMGYQWGLRLKPTPL